MQTELLKPVSSNKTIQRKDILRIYQLTGFKAADGWPNSRLVEASFHFTDEDVNNLSVGVEKNGLIPTKEDKDLLDKILTLNENKETFEVVGEKSSKPFISNQKESPMSTSTVIEKVKEEKKVVVNTKPNDKDQFGHVVTFKGKPSKCASINKALPYGKNNALSAEQIAEKSGSTSKKVTYHLEWFMNPKKRDSHLGRFLQKTTDNKYYVSGDELGPCDDDGNPVAK